MTDVTYFCASYFTWKNRSAWVNLQDKNDCKLFAGCSWHGRALQHFCTLLLFRFFYSLQTTVINLKCHQEHVIPAPLALTFQPHTPIFPSSLRQQPDPLLMFEEKNKIWDKIQQGKDCVWSLFFSLDDLFFLRQSPSNSWWHQILISSQEIALDASFSFLEGQKLPSSVSELLEQLLWVCSGNSTS